MISLGILITSLNQEKDYFIAVAKWGRERNVDTFLLFPNQMDITTKLCNGFAYCLRTDTWVPSIFPLPNVLYDRCFYESELVFKTHYPFVTWLKNQEDTIFLGHGLPNKWVVYNELIKNPLIEPFLPETSLLNEEDNIFKFFSKHQQLLLKPASGSQGKGIFILSENRVGYTLLTKKELHPYYKQLSKKQVAHLLTKLTKKRHYLLQPFLPLQNKDFSPFDIRIYLQKNEKGNWLEIGRGIRTGKVGNYTSNLGSGGTVSSFQDWFGQFSETTKKEIEKQFQLLLEQIPNQLEQHGYPLFELGLDFGFDRDGKLWLLEVNSKPGRKVVITSFPERTDILVKAPIEYCLYLHGKRKGVGVL